MLFSVYIDGQLYYIDGQLLFATLAIFRPEIRVVMHT